MHLSDLDFNLPDELIAQEPLNSRESSRMLVVDRTTARITDRSFINLKEYLVPGDVLVLNDTRVFPARLQGVSDTGASVEIFLLEEIGENTWATLGKPAKRLRSGKKISFDESLSGEVLERDENGKMTIRFEAKTNLAEAFQKVGQTPLPPYISRPEGVLPNDNERYQTVYANNSGAVAAPTAGLHFSDVILRDIERSGIEIVKITLHVGYGTFAPVRVNDLSLHSVAPERFDVSAHSAEVLEKARKENRRIIAVGTTTTRTLEFVIREYGEFRAAEGLANLTIKPKHEFRAVNGMLTNFHLPKSSLLILVTAFGGYDLIMEAYRKAVASRYRFYSYGDCMLII